VKRAPIAVVAGLFAFAYGLEELIRHWQFATSYDLGIFDQAAWHLSKFERPASTISAHANIFGDHLSPIIALFVPAMWIVNRAESLIVCQALLLGASVIPVFFFLRRRLPAAPLLIALAILALDGRAWPLLWGASIGIALVKEDLIPVVAGLGLLTVLAGERRHHSGRQAAHRGELAGPAPDASALVAVRHPADPAGNGAAAIRPCTTAMAG
jgi:hypothetical protein